MDTLQKLNSIEDVDLQALLSHSMRYSLQHNVIASQAEAQAKVKSSPQAAQAAQAAAIHKDTANLLNMLVNKILELQEPPTAATPAKKTRKGK